MSVNSYIAAGTNPGAGVPQMRLNQQQAQRNAYVQDRAFQAEQNRYTQQRQQQINANRMAFGQETLRILASLPEEQRFDAFLARAQEASSNPEIGLPPNFNPEDAFKRTSSQLPPYVAAKAPGAIGNVTPSNYTPESLSAYAQSGDYDDLVRYEPSRTTLIGGVPHAFDPVTSKFYPAEVTQPQTAENPSETRTPVTADTVAASEAEIEAAKVKSREEAEQAALDALRKKKESVTGGQLKDIFAKLDPNAVRGRYGFVGGAAGAWGQDQKNAELLINRITKLLAVNEREKLKGQGTITDNETKMLEDSLSVLSDWQAGDDLAIGELERIAGMFGIEWSGAQSGRGGKTEKVGGATVTFHDD